MASTRAARIVGSTPILGLVLLLLACVATDDEAERSESEPTAQPETIGLYLDLALDETSNEVVQATIAGLAPGHAIHLEDDVNAATATLRVSYDSTNAGAESSLRLWGVYSGFWSDRETWEPGDLEATPLILAEELRTSLEGMLSLGGHPSLQWLPASELAPALDEAPDALTILPVEDAPSTLRSLSINGIDPARDPEAAANPPLPESVHLAWDFAGLDAFVRDVAAALPREGPNITTLMFTGDIIPGRCVYERHREIGDYAAAFRPTAEVLSSADITVGSLDTAISDVGEPIGCQESFNLLSPVETMEGLELAGFDAMTLATNHIQDCGTAGIGCEGRAILDTMENLREYDIAYFGGGENLEAAHQPAVLERNGIRFAFLGYDEIAAHYYGATETAPGSTPLDADRMLQDIEAASLEADVVVVMPHWGEEYVHVPAFRHIGIARDAIAGGATLVVGNHPHVVQGVEWSGDGLAAYALGNFIFDQDWSLETQQGYVLEVTFYDDRIAQVRVLPIRINENFEATWAHPDEAAQIMSDIEASSREIASQ